MPTKGLLRRRIPTVGAAMAALLELSLRLRALPHPLRYGCAALVVLATFALCRAFPAVPRAEPFLPFLPGIIFNALVLNRGSGILSAGFAAILVVVFLVEPVGTLAISDPGKVVALLLFAATGAMIAAIIEELHKAYHGLKAALGAAESAQAETAAADRSKELLLHDLSHRVRNDLQTLVSLLELQIQAQPRGSPVRDALAAAVTRTHVLARAHARLARMGEADAVVRTGEFLGGLCDDLRAALVGDARPQIRVACDVEDHALALSRAVPLGLLANELLTNALKHAFPADRAGSVSLRFALLAPGADGREGSGDPGGGPPAAVFELLVEDDGIGLPAATAGPAPGGPVGGRGRMIVGALARRLGGTLELGPSASGAGSVCRLRFPAAARLATAAAVPG